MFSTPTRCDALPFASVLGLATAVLLSLSLSAAPLSAQANGGGGNGGNGGGTCDYSTSGKCCNCDQVSPCKVIDGQKVFGKYCNKNFSSWTSGYNQCESYVTANCQYFAYCLDILCELQCDTSGGDCNEGDLASIDITGRALERSSERSARLRHLVGRVALNPPSDPACTPRLVVTRSFSAAQRGLMMEALRTFSL
jgi:hypothetical protein